MPGAVSLVSTIRLQLPFGSGMGSTSSRETTVMAGVVYSAHLPSLTMYTPVSSIRSEAFRQLPSRWSVLTFCPPG